MASINELLVSLQQIKQSSTELSTMVAAAGTGLATQANQLGALVRGSQSGQEAVMAVSVASRSLMMAAASIKSLERTCDNYINSAGK